MTPRSIRRAAERKRLKLVRKAEKLAAQTSAQSQGEVEKETVAVSEEKVLSMGAASSFTFTAPHLTEEEPTCEPRLISAAKLTANRANAQLSSGPRTTAGKAKSSLNAVKTGLTGQTVVLPSEDAQAYEAHIARVFDKYKPAAADEQMLVQSIADTEWRLARIPSLESAIYAIGMREFSADFEDESNPESRQTLIRGKVAMQYRRDLTNIALQERRLRNHRERDIQEFAQLREKRQARRAVQVQAARNIIKKEPSVVLADCGFDFTNEELDVFFDSTSSINAVTGEPADFDQFLDAYRNDVMAA